MRLRILLTITACAAALACSGGGGAPPNTPNGCSAEDLQSNPDSCGICGHVCPGQPHSGGRACIQGACGHLPCELGWMDLDPGLAGCETQGTGGVPESGVVFSALTAGGTMAAEPSSNAEYSNVGALGEPTPALEDGAVSSQNDLNQNLPGFESILH